ncbi:hypothetical protein [Pseudomonas atacamensis]|uniref:hypothetical protein n=1 Tax=Pseudomonas atacamensis TaxID=2565368 RepID=UPI0024499C63|nr:hypothetical protein [Pseudomonas atacamensis]MDH2078474.1 hypothetical protein [Pseudomonas atacamensis]
MRKSLLISMFLVCASCAVSHGRPIAHIEYMNVERYLNRNVYPVTFSSDVDVEQLFKSKISQSLLCSFDQKTDFSMPQDLKEYGEGWVEPIKSGDGLVFKADLMFYKVKDSTSYTLMSSNELKALLARQQSLACKVRINSYSYKVYLSEVMKIPVKDLMREVNKY